MNVSVFGGATAHPEETRYQDAQRLGGLLAQRGHTVLTGGYMGTMEAASRGAAEAGGHVIGVTCAEIERWRNAQANPWVKEEWKVETLTDRLTLLIERCDAALALPGGPGTLAEIALLWNRMIVASLPVRPLILIGAGWQATFDALIQSQGPYIHEPQRRLLTFAPTVEAAVAYLPNT
jgi:uncharacterized protein (TIGR00725 family)